MPGRDGSGDRACAIAERLSWHARSYPDGRRFTSPDRSGDLVAAQVYTDGRCGREPGARRAAARRRSQRGLNTVERRDRPASRVPVVYHDPAAELMVLVLGEAHRHREIDERITLLERLRGDGRGDPGVREELRGRVRRARPARISRGARARGARARRARRTRAKDVDKKRLELASREDEIDRAKAQVEHAKAQLEQTRTQLEQARVALDRERSQLAHERAEQQRQQQELDRAARRAARARDRVGPGPGRSRRVRRSRASRRRRTVDAHEAEPTIGHRPQPPEEGEHVDVAGRAARARAARAARSRPRAHAADRRRSSITRASRRTLTEISTEIHVAFDAATSGASPKKRTAANGKHGAHALADRDEETTGTAIIPPGSDPLTTETAGPRRPADARSTGSTSRRPARRRCSRSTTASSGSRCSSDEQHGARPRRRARRPRCCSTARRRYPVITLVFGPPAALRVPSPTQLATVTLDIGAELDRQVLRDARAAGSSSTSIVILRGAPIRSVRLTAPLADNVGYILRAADDHLRGDRRPTPSTQASFERARDLVVRRRLRPARRRPRRDAASSATTSSRSSRPRSSCAARSRSPAGSRGRRARTTWSARAASRCRAGASCAATCSRARSRGASGWAPSSRRSRCPRASRGRAAT